jgi:hypothetical protein
MMPSSGENELTRVVQVNTAVRTQAKGGEGRDNTNTNNGWVGQQPTPRRSSSDDMVKLLVGRISQHITACPSHRRSVSHSKLSLSTNDVDMTHLKSALLKRHE